MSLGLVWNTYGKSVLISFFLVFTFLSPFYSPYARLLLPMMCAAYLLGGHWTGQFCTRQNIHPEGLPTRFQLVSVSVLSFALAFMIIFTGIPERGHTYLPRIGFVTAVERIIQYIQGNSDVMVIGEPAAVFYLRTHVINTTHLDKLGDMHKYYPPGKWVYLICGRYACHNQKDWFFNYPGAIKIIGTGSVKAVSDIRLFDDMSPWAALQWNKGKHRDYDLLLYRLEIPPPRVGEFPAIVAE